MIVAFIRKLVYNQTHTENAECKVQSAECREGKALTLFKSSHLCSEKNICGTKIYKVLKSNILIASQTLYSAFCILNSAFSKKVEQDENKLSCHKGT